MACEDKISNLCGTVTYGSCVRYEGGVSNESELDPVNDCLSIDEVAQDIYNQLDDLNNRVGGQDVQGTVVSVNNIDPDEDGNVQLDADDIPQGSTNQYVSPSEKTTWNGKQNALGFVPVPETRTINGNPLSSDITLNKTDIGLGNVPNIDTTIASNITQTTNYRFVTDTEKAIWNSASSGVVEVTYSALLTLRNTSTLVKGKTYLITDYMTTYIQPVTLALKTSGIVEPLYIIAEDVNKLHNVGRSKLYPQDIIYYEITGEVNGEGTEGFTKGKIYRRIDTLRNNDIGTDWRHVKYDRSGTDKLLFENYSGCTDNVIEEYTLFNSVVGYNFAGNTLDKGFKDNTIGISFTNNVTKQGFSTNNIGNGFASNNVKEGFLNNTVLDNCIYNNIGAGFQNNDLGSNFLSNRIEIGFDNNVVGDDCISNVIEVGCQNNNFGIILQNNIIGMNFTSNIIIDNFVNVTVMQNVSSVDFTAVDIYLKNYVNTVIRKPNGTYEFTYVDNFGDIVIEDIV